MIEKRMYIVSLAQKLQGIPYIWGGSSPQIGFDCSGFVIWIYQVFGLLHAGDWTAHGLWKICKKTDLPQPGDLCFYGAATVEGPRVTHVMLYAGKLNGEDICIGASGGDSTTGTREIARSKNAMVKSKPVRYRRDFLGYGTLISSATDTAGSDQGHETAGSSASDAGASTV